jgi:hypothetical protein
MATLRPEQPAVPEAEEAPRVLTPEAQRALAEAEARRKAAADASGPKELGGREGPDPVRYGDWENGGIASDF